LKLLSVLAILVALTYFVIFNKENTDISPLEKQKAESLTSIAKDDKLFMPGEVTKLIWFVGKTKIELTKLGEHWHVSPSYIPIDEWNIQRRIVTLSKVSLKSGITIIEPSGEVEFTTPIEKFHGIYNNSSFLWTNGSRKDHGFLFAENPDIKSLFDEGLWGFQPHVLKICDSNKIKSVTFKDWSLEKNFNEWQVVEKGSKVRARPDLVEVLAKSLCQFKVDNFVEDVKAPDSTPKIRVKTSSREIDFKNDGELYFVTEYPIGLKSHYLAGLLSSTNPSSMKDPSLEEAKTAADRKASNEDRISAIRKLRGNQSPEALASLKTIIFEKTDIDLFRYEAVDSLVAIGTKDAYKVIADRLSEVGRSGFELRLARALAPALGSFFSADEKTPESERRPQVDALIKAAAAHPPGK
jgi:hypothetical protein